MPANPLAMLKKVGQWATTPLMDEETIAPAQEALDSPSLDRSPWEARIGGFGAGVLEGLRGQTSPLSLAGNAMMGAGPALRALQGLRGATQGMGGLMSEAGQLSMGGGRAAQRMAPTMDIVEQMPVKQINPGMGDVDALIGDMQRNLARVPSRGQAAGQPTVAAPKMAPRLPAEMVPRGGEAAYNAGASQVPAMQATDAYSQLMRRFGGQGR